MSYTIKKMRTTGAAVLGWKPYSYWAAVDDDTGKEHFSGDTKADVLVWGQRMADEINGTWRGLSYEQYQAAD